MATGYKVSAVVLFLLAAICLVAGVTLYVVWHIREVHDTLTGKTAQRRIAELRSASGRWQTVGSRVAVDGSALDQPWDAKDIDRALGFSSLGITGDGHHASGSMSGYSGNGDDDDKLGTTLLSGEDEKTSLRLREGGEAHSTNDVNHKDTSIAQRDQDDQEATSVLLSSGKHVQDEDDELGTTLLGRDD